MVVVNLLPWLLKWPPRPATLLAFLVLSAFSLGTLVLFAPLTDQINPDEATIEVTNASITLNDDIEISEFQNGSVQKCLASGTPGDHLTVTADIAVETPLDDGSGTSADNIKLHIEESSLTTTEPVEQTGRDHIDAFWVVRDDEALTVDETATLRVHLRDSDTVIANGMQTVTVEEGVRSYNCET